MTFDPFNLAGKHVLVTGASSGIGRQVALSCALRGARVSITGRDALRLQETLNCVGTAARAIRADLTDAHDLKELVEAVDALDGVVHAAGTSRLVPFRLLQPKHLDEAFASNTYAPLLLTQKLLAARKIVQGASILFISAAASHAGPVASSAYAASKAALLGAVRSLAEDTAKQNIRANCVAPGYVKTAMLEHLTQGGSNLQERIGWAPLGMGDPKDIGNAAVFYLSDASRSINRSYFFVDGGITLSMGL